MSRYTRRVFLEDSVLAAAVTAAFPVGNLFAADGKKKEPSSAKKKDKKKEDRPVPKKSADAFSVAIVGVGGRGGNHVEEFLYNPDAKITYIVDADEQRGQAFVKHLAEKQGFAPKFAKDLRVALDDKSVNIVSTATPNHWHALCAIWSMQAGKDVYVEKPVSHNVSEGRRIVEAARKYGRICQTGTQCRSLKGTIDAVEYVKSGKIGEMKLARGLCYKRRKSIGPKGNYQVPATVDYNLWCGPARTLPLTRPKFHYDWHSQREWGNGDMGNQGPHQMDIARWGLDVHSVADSVITFGGRLGYEDAGDVANTEVAILEFGGKTLVFEVRGLETDPFRDAEVGVVFYGSQGCVVLGSYQGGVALDNAGKVVQKFNGKGDHFGNFLKAVKARDYKLLNADILEGHLSCANSHLANISYYLGKPASVKEIKKTLGSLKTNEDVADCLDRTLKHLAANKVDLAKTPMSLGPMLKIDVANETVLDNAAACTMLTREYRAPFIVPKAGAV